MVAYFHIQHTNGRNLFFGIPQMSSIYHNSIAHKQIDIDLVFTEQLEALQE